MTASQFNDMLNAIREMVGTHMTEDAILKHAPFYDYNAIMIRYQFWKTFGIEFPAMRNPPKSFGK